MALRTVGVRLTADVTGFVSRLKAAGGSVKDFQNRLADAQPVAAFQNRMRAAEGSVKDFHKRLNDQAATGGLDNIADRAAVMGLGLAAGFGYAVKAAAGFEKEMSAVKAATRATGAELDALKQAALQAGKTTQYSATEAAKGITELAKAGIKSKDVLSGGLKGALDLAAAGQMDVAEAAETAASAMTQFKLKGSDVPHIADLLASAAGNAQGSVHDMGMALNQAGLVAAQTGLSIEETTGGLAAFANAGLIGSDAGTSFKQMLLMLQAPSDKSKDLMNELGISLYDAQGQFIGLSKFAGQLQTAFKDLTPEARAAAAAQIFGADATRAASVMYEQGAAGIDQWIKKVNDQGYASRVAATLTDNLAGDVERLKGAMETFAIEAGGGATGGLRILVQALNKIVDAFSALPAGVTSTLTVMAGVGGVLLLAAAAWIKMRRAVADVSEELRNVGPAGERAARGLDVARKAAAGFMILEAASIAIKAFTGTAPDIDRMTKALKELQDTGKVTGELEKVFGKSMEGIATSARMAEGASHGFGKVINNISSAIPIFGDFVDAGQEAFAGDSWNSGTEKMKAFDASLSQHVVALNDVKKATEIWNRVSKETGMDHEQLRKILPSTWAAMGKLSEQAHATGGAMNGLGEGTAAVAEQQKEFASSAEASTAALKGQRDAFVELANKMKQETDPVFAFIEAQNALTKAQAKATEAVKKHGRTSDEAKEATRKLAEAAIELQMRAGGVADTFNGKMTPELYATLRAAGLTGDQIRTLEGEFKDVQKAAENYAKKDYKPEVGAPGAKNAKKELEQALAAGLGFNREYKGKTTAPGANTAAAEIQNAWNKANGFDGNYKGFLSAPGAKTAEQAAADAWAQAKGFDGKYTAKLYTTGGDSIKAELADLLIKQRALATGQSYTAARAGVQKDLDRGRQGKYADGGFIYGPGSETSDSIPAMLSKNEYVIKASSVKRLGVSALDHMNRTGELPAKFALGGYASFPFPTTLKNTKIPDPAVMGGTGGPVPNFGGWPSSPRSQRGDSGIWRRVLQLIKSGPRQGSFGNAYRPGDPKWHGSGRAVDWMGFNMDALASYLASKRPLELIHRTRNRDYAYTRGVNKGSFNQSLMNAHRNHIHIAMANGGVIGEPVFGVGKSGKSYSFGERGPERVIPHGFASGGLVGVAPSTESVPTSPAMLRTAFAESAIQAKEAVQSLTEALKANGKTFSFNTVKGQANNKALIAGIKAAQDAAKAKYEETGSVAAANKVYDQYVHQLNLAMQKNKMSNAQRQTLLKQYSSRPTYSTPLVGSSNSSLGIAQVQGLMGAEEQIGLAANAFAWTKPTFNYRTETGRAEVSALISYVQAAAAAAQGVFDFSGNAGHATSVYNGYIDNLRKILGKWMSKADIDRYLKSYAKITLTKNRWGGLYEHAADGALKDAQIAGAGPTRYAWAEPQTGGELFAPKHGNLAKTRSQVAWAVNNWWGGQVSWDKQRGGAPIVVQATIPITLGTETITRQVRFEVDTAVGQIANAAVYQTA